MHPGWLELGPLYFALGSGPGPGAGWPAGRPGPGGRDSGRLKCYLRYPRIANPGGRGSGRLNLLKSVYFWVHERSMRAPCC